MTPWNYGIDLLRDADIDDSILNVVLDYSENGIVGYSDEDISIACMNADNMLLRVVAHSPLPSPKSGHPLLKQKRDTDMGVRDTIWDKRKRDVPITRLVLARALIIACSMMVGMTVAIVLATTVLK